MKNENENEIRAPKLLVDNLRHLSDHGVAVEFTAPKLQRLVSDLRALDAGSVTLKAGKSRLTVTRLGKVTLTDAFFDVGCRRVRRVHYFSPAENLKFAISRDSGEAMEEQAFELCYAVIFGAELPAFFRPSCGQRMDALRTFLQKFGDLYLGESALRARAIAKKGEALRAEERQSKFALENARETLERWQTEQTPESFRENHARLRQRCETHVAQLAQRDAALREHLAKAQAPELSASELAELAIRYGATRDFSAPNWNADLHGALKFDATQATFSHEITRPNYKATVSESGEISFNSGIKCPFTLAQLVAWLKGDAPAPQTAYGAVQRLEVGLPGTLAPRVFLRCGCHRIDAAADVPALAPYLTPSHVVTQLSGLDCVCLCDGREPFVARLCSLISAAISENETQRATVLREFVARKKALEDAEKNLPARLQELRESVTLRESEHAKALAAVARDKEGEPIGANVQTCAQIAQTLARAFTFNFNA